MRESRCCSSTSSYSRVPGRAVRAVLASPAESASSDLAQWGRPGGRLHASASASVSRTRARAHVQRRSVCPGASADLRALTSSPPPPPPPPESRDFQAAGRHPLDVDIRLRHESAARAAAVPAAVPAAGRAQRPVHPAEAPARPRPARPAAAAAALAPRLHRMPRERRVRRGPLLRAGRRPLQHPHVPADADAGQRVPAERAGALQHHRGLPRPVAGGAERLLALLPLRRGPLLPARVALVPGRLLTSFTKPSSLFKQWWNDHTIDFEKGAQL